MDPAIIDNEATEGKGYRLLSEPGDIRANQYPPLLPAIIAVHEKLLHSTDPVRVGIWLRRTWIVFSVFYIAVAFRLGRLLAPAKYAVWLAAVALLNFDMFFYGLSTVLTLAAICTSPWPGQFGRYLSPMLPLLLLCLMAGVGIVAGGSPASAKWRNRKVAILRAVLFLLILADCGLALMSGVRNFLSPVYYGDREGKLVRYHLVYYLPDYTDVKAMLSWLLPKADPHAVTAAVMPEWFYLQSGLKTVMPPLTRNAVRAQAEADSVPVSYVVIEILPVQDNFNSFFPKLVENSPGKWKLLCSASGRKVQLYGRLGVARLNGELLTD